MLEMTYTEFIMSGICFIAMAWSGKEIYYLIKEHFRIFEENMMLAEKIKEEEERAKRWRVITLK